MTKEFHFSPEDLYNLLVHYTNGGVPLNGEVTDFLVHPQMRRKIGLLVLSDEWETKEPLFIGYDGKRSYTWTKGSGQDIKWEEKEETPKQQGGTSIG